jgi:anaerobic ribonucleoside-triphosphate reductase activating protein
VQGCPHHCHGCHNPESWSFDGGYDISVEEVFEQIKEGEGLRGVTFSGGEPFEQAKELSLLSEMVKQAGLSVVCFTGYTIEELNNKNDKYINEFLKHIDLLIDGGFEQDKFDLSRPWVGSSNQRYHFLTDFYTPEIIDKYKNKIEARIMRDGSILINGMGNFEKIKRQMKI